MGFCRGEGDHSTLGANGPWERTGSQKEGTKLSEKRKKKVPPGRNVKKLMNGVPCAENSNKFVQYTFYCEL